MDHKRCVQLAIICYLITLDKVLEADDICDGFLAVQDYILVAQYLVFLGDLQTTVPLLVIEKAFSALIMLGANVWLQHKLKVDWLSNRSTFLRSKSVNFLDLRVRTTLGWCSSSISIASWKWLDLSSEDNKDHSSSLHF